MVFMMMAGVVRKKKRKKRKVLIAMPGPPMEAKDGQVFPGGMEEGDETLGLSPQTQPRCFHALGLWARLPLWAHACATASLGLFLSHHL